jgi:hypothetical protein
MQVRTTGRPLSTTELAGLLSSSFAFITDLVRPVGTYFYGRRMYETMAVWETGDEQRMPEASEPAARAGL